MINLSIAVRSADSLLGLKLLVGFLKYYCSSVSDPIIIGGGWLMEEAGRSLSYYQHSISLSSVNSIAITMGTYLLKLYLLNRYA